MGFMDKLKETAGKAAEKAGAMKDSAMDTYGKMKEANEQKKAEKQAYTAAMEQEVNEYSTKLIENITAEYAEGGAKFWGEATGLRLTNLLRIIMKCLCFLAADLTFHALQCHHILMKRQ